MKTTKKVKLSPTQIQVIERLKKEGNVKIGGRLDVTDKTARLLIKLGICDYNSLYNGIVLTDLGKTYEI